MEVVLYNMLTNRYLHYVSVSMNTVSQVQEYIKKVPILIWWDTAISTVRRDLRKLVEILLAYFYLFLLQAKMLACFVL
jgi:hypothetical protein